MNSCHEEGVRDQNRAGIEAWDQAASIPLDSGREHPPHEPHSTPFDPIHPRVMKAWSTFGFPKNRLKMKVLLLTALLVAVVAAEHIVPAPHA
eukprot:gene25944-biopygen12048